ncbi:MAG: acyl transferase [Crocinitomicaceae bacterium]|nr:acyl transferase [Crocinitomicaceae bacterium]
MLEDLENRIFTISSEDEFAQLALDIFQYQYTNVPVYRDYVNQLGKEHPKELVEIPFLPISFFKSHVVKDDQYPTQVTFKSSGTDGERSQHHVVNTNLYEKSFNQSYDRLIGNPKEQVILALLPNYLEQGESSLVYMVDHLIKRTDNSISGFVLDDMQSLVTRHEEALSQNKQVVIFGVSYALLDLCDLKPDLSQAIIIETGGMKGRRKEITKSELHGTLKSGLNCSSISSEYGMTELLSQGYSTHEGVFELSSTMKILIREVNDPFSYTKDSKMGGVNIIDLANLYSCAFIETQDLGKISEKGFEIMGRFDNSDIRGCNLLME